MMRQFFNKQTLTLGIFGALSSVAFADPAGTVTDLEDWGEAPVQQQEELDASAPDLAVALKIAFEEGEDLSIRNVNGMTLTCDIYGFTRDLETEKWELERNPGMEISFESVLPSIAKADVEGEVMMATQVRNVVMAEDGDYAIAFRKSSTSNRYVVALGVSADEMSESALESGLYEATEWNPSYLNAGYGVCVRHDLSVE